MAKIPIILEPGRADGKLATSGAIFDENKGMFQSEINDIQDTLNSDNPNKPLSAKQGKVLKELLNSKVIEAGSVPIDTEPTEGNITHIVNSDGLAKEFNKCNTTIINTDRIANEAIIPSKLSVDIQNLITNLSKTTTFAGIATPATNPGTPDGPVFYIATTAGNYSNFGNIEISKGESAILNWNEGTWTKSSFKPMTDFNSVFDTNGKSLTYKLSELEGKVGEELNLSSQSSGSVIKEYKIHAGEKYVLINLADRLESVKTFDKDGNLFNWNKPKEKLFSIVAVGSEPIIITPTLDAEGIGVYCTTKNINVKILNYNSLAYTDIKYGKNLEDIDKSIADINELLNESNTKFEEFCYKETTNIPFDGGNGYLKMDSTSIVTDVSWFYTEPIKVQRGDKIECESTCSTLVNKAVIAKYNNINGSYEPLVPFTSIEKKKYIYEFTEDCEIVCFNYNNTDIDNNPTLIKVYSIKNYVDTVKDNITTYVDTVEDNITTYVDTVKDNITTYVDTVKDNITTYERNLCWSKGGIDSTGNFSHINEDGSIYRKRTSFLDGGIISLGKECSLSFAYYDENKVFKKYVNWSKFSDTIDINRILNENESKYVIIIVDNHPYYNIGDKDIIWFDKGCQSLSTTIDDIKLSKYSLTDVEKAMIRTVKEIRQNSPRAIIYLIGNFYTGNDYQKNYYRRRYYAELKAVAEYFGCEYISLLGCGIMENNIKEENYGYYTKDGVHAYLKEGAERIFNFINGRILSDISNLSGKKVLILGDSSCVQEPHFSDSEAVKFANRDKKVWTQLLAEKYPEATIIVKSQGGSGWMYNGETSQRTCLVQYNENKDKNFDVILITTGANDGLQNFSIGNYEKMLDVLLREDITINGYNDKPIYSIE